MKYLVNELETITQMHHCCPESFSFFLTVQNGVRETLQHLHIPVIKSDSLNGQKHNESSVWPQASGSSLEVHLLRKTYLLCVKSHIRQLHRNKNKVFIEKQSQHDSDHFLALSSGCPKIRLSRCTRIKTFVN